jgi:cytochrome P450
MEVGALAYSLHRHDPTFSSPDTEKWDPDRWLQSPPSPLPPETSSEKCPHPASTPSYSQNDPSDRETTPTPTHQVSSHNLTEMKRHTLTFGTGPRMCIGMPLAMVMMKMLLARIYSIYETELGSEWFDQRGKVKNAWERGPLWPRKDLGGSREKIATLVFRRVDG